MNTATILHTSNCNRSFRADCQIEIGGVLRVPHLALFHDFIMFIERLTGLPESSSPVVQLSELCGHMLVG